MIYECSVQFVSPDDESAKRTAIFIGQLLRQELRGPLALVVSEPVKVVRKEGESRVVTP